jgi:hypothetical protein
MPGTGRPVAGGNPHVTTFTIFGAEDAPGEVQPAPPEPVSVIHFDRNHADRPHKVLRHFRPGEVPAGGCGRCKTPCTLIRTPPGLPFDLCQVIPDEPPA